MTAPIKDPMTFTWNQAKLRGVISWVPCCLTVLCFFLIAPAGQSELVQMIMPGSLLTIFIVVIITPLALVIFTIVLISRETGLASNQKYSWGWIVFLFHVMAFPLVWYTFVWRKLKEPANMAGREDDLLV